MLSRDVSEVWSVGSYERIAARFAPVQDELVERLRVAPGDRVLDLATGTGEVAIRAAARRRRRDGDRHRGADDREGARGAPRRRRVASSSTSGTSSTCPTRTRASTCSLSNFGLVFAPDHANVAAELARVTCRGGRVGFTAWKPNPKLGELYRRFTDEPIEGREAYEWGREDHVEEMLGEDFELEFEDGTLWIEAESGEEIWKLFSESAPPVVALLARLDDEPSEEFHKAFVELRRATATARAASASRAATCSSSEGGSDGVRGAEGAAERDVGQRPLRSHRGVDRGPARIGRGALAVGHGASARSTSVAARARVAELMARPVRPSSASTSHRG